MMLFGLVFRPVCTLDNDVASVPLLLFNLLVDNFSGVLLCVFMKCRHFPTFFCAGTKKKKYVDVADRACRPNFADIVGCRRHVGDMSPTCAAKSACDADLGEGGSDVEGEDNTVWFYNRCASSAANVNSTTLEVSTQIMRFLKSAFHGNEPGIEFMCSADRIQKLKIDMLKDPSLFLFSQADDLLVRDISNRALRLLHTPDFDEQTLQAIDHLKDFRQDIDAEDLSLADGDDIGVALVNSGEYDTTSDVSSYHPSDSNDADSDLDTKPAAKKKSPRKGEKKMGADVGVAKNEVISAEDYDDAVFQDDEEVEDLSYYKSTTQGKKGRPLCDGGPKKPDTSGLSEVAAEIVLKRWRIERKAYNDKMQRIRRKELRAGGSMGSNHTGHLSPQLRNMATVEREKMTVNDTFPSKEILLIRIAEEANLTGVNISVKRSDDFRFEVVGSNQSQFAVVAACSSGKGWRVTACDTRLQVPNTTTTDHATADAFKEDKEDTDDDGVEGDSDEISDDEDGEDEDTPKHQRKYKSLIPRTPIKARWLLPFINDKIADTPNISNREMRNLSWRMTTDQSSVDVPVEYRTRMEFHAIT